MAKKIFGKLEIDPVKNPSVLNTATWDKKEAGQVVQGLDAAYWGRLEESAKNGKPLPETNGFIPYTGSVAKKGNSVFCLAGLADHQQVLIEISSGGGKPTLSDPFVRQKTENDGVVYAYETVDSNLYRFFSTVDGRKGPKPLGIIPRLGIGDRMSTSIWPAVWPAMHDCDFKANAIQNSVRELGLLNEMTAGKPARENYLFSFGRVQEAHTGSTFEGLWTYGVLDALKSDVVVDYGADADHLQVKRGAEGVERTKQFLDASRFYTFYTMDVSDILDFQALNNMAHGSEYLGIITDSILLRDLRNLHLSEKRIGGTVYSINENILGTLVGKYWKALNALEELVVHLNRIKGDDGYDLELSIDENPPEVKTCDILTTETELIFLILEAQRRNIPITHIAPNFGVEKGTDYRCPDGHEGLHTRVRAMTEIAKESDIMLDCHSGDDLSSETNRVLGKASNGRIHFKVSPMLQLIFAETMKELLPDQFRSWWEETKRYVEREAEHGSSIAIDSMKEYEKGSKKEPSVEHTFFHHYHFVPVGLRDEKGQFVLRELFYDLPDSFLKEYRSRLHTYLCNVAADVFNRR